MRTIPTLLWGALPAALASLVLVLSACHKDVRVVDQGPEYDRGAFEEHASFAAQKAGTLKIEVTNSYGDVWLKPSQSNEAEVHISYEGGFNPARQIVRKPSAASPGRVLVLEASDDPWAKDLLLPRPSDDATVLRGHNRLPKVRVYLLVPAHAQITVHAASALHAEDVQADVRARVGGDVIWRAGGGSLHADCQSLDVRAAALNLQAQASNQVTLSNVQGDKVVAGDADVAITGGQGFLSIDVQGDVYADTAIAGARARTEYLADTQAGDSDPLMPRGPTSPGRGAGEGLRADATPAASIVGDRVVLRMTSAAKLDLSCDVSGGLQWSTTKALQDVVNRGEPGDPTLTVREEAESRLNLALNSPVSGELRVIARQGLNLVIDR